MEIIRYPKIEDYKQLLSRPIFEGKKLEETVQPILNDIEQNGDKAIVKYTEKFDNVRLDSLEASQEEISKAYTLVDQELKEAIKIAKRNIEVFHKSQIQNHSVIETAPGVKCWQKSIAIEKVGLYIPGGSAPLFSTVLMLAVPACIAGCKEIILCTPPNEAGTINPAILYAAKESGVKNIYKVGGVQAIGAMAYGTETIPKVYKIFGPGNQYVTSAKQLVARDEVAIDMPAGPSEVAILAEETSNASFIASDLLSQAEHGIDSQSILITTSDSLIHRVKDELIKQLDLLPRKEIAAKSLENGKLFLVKDMEEMMALVNEYAPEHLIISTKNANELADKVVNAGSVFIGEYTPESAGDYASGTNHTLPTNGYAKSYNGVNLDSYVRKVTFQEITQTGLREIGPPIIKMATMEMLDAHARAVTLRLENN